MILNIIHKEINIRVGSVIVIEDGNICMVVHDPETKRYGLLDLHTGVNSCNTFNCITELIKYYLLEDVALKNIKWTSYSNNDVELTVKEK